MTARRPWRGTGTLGRVTTTDLLPGGYDGILEEACAAYPAGADPSLFFLALRRAFAQRHVPIEFMAHPEHGDVIARAEALERGSG